MRLSVMAGIYKRVAVLATAVKTACALVRHETCALTAFRHKARLFSLKWSVR
jgi:hypothetical protein